MAKEAKPKEKLTTLEFIQAWESYWKEAAPKGMYPSGSPEERKAAILNWDTFVEYIHAAEVTAGCIGKRTPGKNINLRCRVIFRAYKDAGYQAPMLIPKPSALPKPTTIAQMLAKGILKAKKLPEPEEVEAK